jgi:two-component system, chemotaxis family, chemotaxis protein CheY
MVVDSDTNNLCYTATMLRRFSYETDTVKTAKEAITRALISPPSLIITSLELTDMHGLDFVQNLKQEPAAAAVPFITLRRQGDLQGEKKSLERGARECLYQPVAPEKLYEAVQSATETRPRRNIRLQVNLPVNGEGSSGSFLQDTLTSDISERGIFLQSAEPAPVKTEVSLRICVNGRFIPVQATVVYSFKTAGGPYLQPGMGLEFNQISRIDQNVIQQFVRNEITRGILPGNV